MLPSLNKKEVYINKQVYFLVVNKQVLNKFILYDERKWRIKKWFS